MIDLVTSVKTNVTMIENRINTIVTDSEKGRREIDFSDHWAVTAPAGEKQKGLKPDNRTSFSVSKLVSLSLASLAFIFHVTC